MHSDAGAVGVGGTHDLSEVVNGPSLAVTAGAESAKIFDIAVGPEHSMTDVNPAGVRRAYYLANIVEVPCDGAWPIGKPGQFNEPVGIGVKKCRGSISSHGPADHLSLLVDAPGDTGCVAGQNPQVLHDVRSWVSRY